jgi:hypothetical protein
MDASRSVPGRHVIAVGGLVTTVLFADTAHWLGPDEPTGGPSIQRPHLEATLPDHAHSHHAAFAGWDTRVTAASTSSDIVHMTSLWRAAT